MLNSFAFILNQVEIQANLPLELIPNHFLQKADDEQVAKIKKRLLYFASSEMHDGLYERSFEKAGPNPEDGFRMLPASREFWRYWIVVFEGPNTEMGDLEMAFALLLNDLRFGFTIVNNFAGGEAFLWSQEMMSEYSSVHRLFQPPSVIAEDEIRQVGPNYSALKNIKVTFPNIYRAIQRFHQLKHLPELSEFKIIGFFSVIEALITHAPELSEPMDSLTHQMKSKMNLLSKRFQRRLDYDAFFGTPDGDKVWGKLYGYRSKLAHGDLADFERDFKLLRSSQHAMRFLNEAAKLLILCAMNEPELISDLKRC